MLYVAGLDGGGTKTAVAIADETGLVVHTFLSGSINYNGHDEVDIAGSFRHIFDTIATVCGDLDSCAHICIGAAGVSNPDARAALARNVKLTGYSGGLSIAGDHETALVGAHGQRQGIILIAGTGSICYGINKDGASHRSGGFGHLVDDGGSGYSIGRDLVTALIKASDGRSSGTVITELVFEQLGITTVQQLVGYVYDKQRNKKDIAALAPLLSVACSHGDQAAKAIVRSNAASLLELVVPVADKLELSKDEIALAGGILFNNVYLRDSFQELLKGQFPEMRSFQARNDASYGAILMALESWNNKRSERI